MGYFYTTDIIKLRSNVSNKTFFDLFRMFTQSIIVATIWYQIGIKREKSFVSFFGKLTQHKENNRATINLLSTRGKQKNANGTIKIICHSYH